jgi:hypothetical protein
MSNTSANDRVEIPSDAFLRVTGQLWKVIVASLVLPWPVVVTGIWVFRRLGPDQSLDGVLAAIGAMAAIAALIVFLLASVRCPHCRARVLSRVIWAPDGLGALTGLLNSRACPACGHVPKIAISN